MIRTKILTNQFRHNISARTCFFFFRLAVVKSRFSWLWKALKVAIAPLMTGGRCRQEKLAQKKTVRTVSWDKKQKSDMWWR